ncbi:MAG: phosphoglycolate phosphatase [Rhodospirillales bacterium]|nr:phosphoglycolate phosphatase [Rhodospirillales bacterium]
MAFKRDALLFDLDGTLVDSLPDLALAMNQVLAEEGRAPLALAEVRLMVGDGVPKLVARGLTAAGLPVEALLERAVAHFLDLYEGGPAAHTTIYPDVPEVLEALRVQGYRLAVCTNKPVDAANHVLRALGLAPLLDAVIGGGSTPALKPDPQPFLAALAALGAPLERGIMIGDSPADIEGARRTGLPAIAVTWGYTRLKPEELGADHLIERFADLPAALLNY